MKCKNTVGRLLEYVAILVVVITYISLTGCVTVGRMFDPDMVTEIEINKTTRDEIETKFGQPFREGLNSGNPTAAYIYYQVGLFGKPVTTDLTITYDGKGKVITYVFNTNQRKEPDAEK